MSDDTATAANAMMRQLGMAAVGLLVAAVAGGAGGAVDRNAFGEDLGTIVSELNDDQITMDKDMALYEQRIIDLEGRAVVTETRYDLLYNNQLYICIALEKTLEVEVGCK